MFFRLDTCQDLIIINKQGCRLARKGHGNTVLYILYGNSQKSKICAAYDMIKIMSFYEIWIFTIKTFVMNSSNRY